MLDISVTRRRTTCQWTTAAARHGTSIEPFPQAARRRGELCADAERGLRRVLVLRAPLDGRVEQRQRWLVEAAPTASRKWRSTELRRGGLVAAHPAVVRE